MNKTFYYLKKLLKSRKTYICYKNGYNLKVKIKLREPPFLSHLKVPLQFISSWPAEQRIVFLLPSSWPLHQLNQIGAIITITKFSFYNASGSVAKSAKRAKSATDCSAVHPYNHVTCGSPFNLRLDHPLQNMNIFSHYPLPLYERP